MANTRKNSRRANRKNTRRANRKERKSRRNTRRTGGGLVGTVYKPVGTFAKGAAGTLDAAVNGANKTLKTAANTLNRTARNVLRPFGLARRH